MINLGNARTRKVSEIGTQHALSYIVVITIEDKGKILVKNPVVGFVWLQNKFLKKPRRVAKMPFGRRDIHDGLEHIVLNFQRFANSFGVLAGVEKKLGCGIDSNHNKSAAFFATL